MNFKSNGYSPDLYHYIIHVKVKKMFLIAFVIIVVVSKFLTSQCVYGMLIWSGNEGQFSAQMNYLEKIQCDILKKVDEI